MLITTPHFKKKNEIALNEIVFGAFERELPPLFFARSFDAPLLRLTKFLKYDVRMVTNQ